MKNFVIKSLCGLIAIAAIVSPASASAATGSGLASLHFSPASGSYTTGSTITVNISETSSTPVAAVEADFTYPASLLQYAGASITGPFQTAYLNNGGNGSVSLVLGTQGTTVSGTQAVASVSFKVLAAGSASLSMLNSSEIDDATTANVCDSTCASGAKAAGFALSAPATTPTQPTSGGGSTGTGTPTSTSNSSSKPASTSTGTTSTATGATNTTTSGSTTIPAKPTTKGSKNTTATKPKTIKSHRTGVVTTSVILIAALAAGFYWLVLRKRVEVAAAPASYKLAGSAAKSTGAKKVAANKTGKTTKTAASRKPAAKKAKKA